MHTAVAYNKDGKKTNTTYHAYNKILVDSKPVTIKGDLYYKIADKDNQYVKTTNIDGVTRKITRNTYIYKTATKRTFYNGRWSYIRDKQLLPTAVLINSRMVSIILESVVQLNNMLNHLTSDQ